MIDDVRTTTEDDEQADAVEKIGTDTPREDALEDLDVTTSEGAEVKGGIPRRAGEA